MYCHIWAIKVCAAVKGMVFKQFTLELLVFGVTPFKIHLDQNKNQNWKVKGSKYTKTLAKIQVRGIFRTQDIQRNVSTKFIEICMETLCWCPRA